MAGRKGRSGGWNRLSPEEHAARGTKPRYRHPALVAVAGANALRLDPAPAVTEGVSLGDKRRLLAGLDGDGRRLALAALESHTGWTPMTLGLLRSFALATGRLRALEGDPTARPVDLARETRTVLALASTLRINE